MSSACVLRWRSISLPVGGLFILKPFVNKTIYCKLFGVIYFHEEGSNHVVPFIFHNTNRSVWSKNFSDKSSWKLPAITQPAQLNPHGRLPWADPGIKKEGAEKL